MTGNGDLPPKETGVDQKPGVVTPDAVKKEPAPPAPKPPVTPKPPAAPAAGDVSISGRIEQYEKTVRLNSIVRVSFPLLVLSLIIVFLLATWLTIWGAFPEKSINTETVRAGEQLLPYFNKVMKTFADDVAPEIMEEFELRLAEAGDKVTKKLADEIEHMRTSNEQFIKDQALIAIAEKKESHKKLLLELYPELKNDPAKLEVFTEKLNKAFEYWTVAYMTRVMADYFDTMGQINETIIKGYKGPAKVEGSGHKKVVEAEMLELFMELMNAAYEEPVGDAKIQGEGKGEEPAPAAEPEAAPVEEPVAEAAPEAPAPEGSEAPADDKSATESAEGR